MAQSGKRESILVLDDREDVRRAIARYLRMHFEVFAVGTSEEAEAVLEREEPCLLLSDYWLGRGQPLGTDLIARWRVQYPFIRLAALMTGTKATAVVDTDGIDQIFAKPLNMPIVVSWFHDGLAGTLPPPPP